MNDTTTTAPRRPIPMAAIKRLPIYYHYLTGLREAGILRVSSDSLARMAGVTAAQLRRDLNHFGSFGQQGCGYNTDVLHAALGSILGLDRSYRMVVIGAGNIGSALASYPGFARRGFQIEAVFDSDASRIGTASGSLSVLDAAGLGAYVSSRRVDIAAIAVPDQAAQAVADVLVAAGIRGIWNFAHVRLNVPDIVTVEQVNLTDSLMTLAYRLDGGQVGSGA